MDNTPTSAAGAVVAVAPSAAVELCALFCTSSTGRAPRVAIPAALAARANRFWGDGHPGLAEGLVLAYATGSLDDPGIDGFIERLRAPVDVDANLPLETEPEDERVAIRARLKRLASDARLRTRYVALVGDLWASFGEAWAEGGLAQARAAAAAWSERLDSGADALELLPDYHIARREEFAPMVRRAQREGVLRISPSVAGHGHIVALPGLLSISADAAAEDSAVARRRGAAEIADRLRVLSDPTRLTILAQLAQAPVGVSELARALHIAQPTASVHLRRLREAGLVTAERSGTRSVYSALPEAVEDLLAEVTERVARSMRR